MSSSRRIFRMWKFQSKRDKVIIHAHIKADECARCKRINDQWWFYYGLHNSTLLSKRYTDISASSLSPPQSSTDCDCVWITRQHEDDDRWERERRDAENPTEAQLIAKERYLQFSHNQTALVRSVSISLLHTQPTEPKWSTSEKETRSWRRCEC